MTHPPPGAAGSATDGWPRPSVPTPPPQPFETPTVPANMTKPDAAALLREAGLIAAAVDRHDPAEVGKARARLAGIIRRLSSARSPENDRAAYDVQGLMDDLGG